LWIKVPPQRKFVASSAVESLMLIIYALSSKVFKLLATFEENAIAAM